MIETIVVIVIVILMIVGIIMLIYGSSKVSKDADTTRPSQISIPIPHPEQTNDYRFYKAIEAMPPDSLKKAYPQLKKNNIYLKPEFEAAIRQQIETGDFKNPIDFKDYFGTKFDMIGIHFVKGTKDDLSTFQMGVYFIQNNLIGDSENFFFKPPSNIYNSEEFRNKIKMLGIDLEAMKAASFKKTWEEFEFSNYFNSNLLVFWDEDADILKNLLKNNEIKDYNMKYIRTRKIIQDQKLPDSIEDLLNHIKTDFTVQTDISLIAASLFKDFKNAGLNPDKYIETSRA